MSGVLTRSTMPALETPLPPFEHPVPDNPALLVAFICAHCEYTEEVRKPLVELSLEYRRRGLGILAINPNEPIYPEDAPEHMAKAKYPFPYVYDATQAFTLAMGAACTPDFFLYGRERALLYRGRFDELPTAVDAVLSGQPVAPGQLPSMGCSIKWRRGNEPAHYMPRLRDRLYVSWKRWRQGL
jgi:hypothetical protein